MAKDRIDTMRTDCKILQMLADDLDVRTGDIVAALGMSRQGVHKAMKRLTGSDFAKRRQDPDNTQIGKPSIVFYITEKGLNRLKSLQTQLA